MRTSLRWEPGTSGQRAESQQDCDAQNHWRNGRVTKRAVSNDFGVMNATNLKGFEPQISLEGALFGSALGEGRIEAREVFIELTI